MNYLSKNSTSSQTNFSFRKEEKLCSKKVIGRLFAEGKTVFAFPLKIIYIETELKTEMPVQIGFAVSKRNFKRAVQRNLIKRRLREAYRLEKPTFYDALNHVQLAAFFVYTAKEIVDYSVIELAVKKGLKKLAKACKANITETK